MERREKLAGERPRWNCCGPAGDRSRAAKAQVRSECIKVIEVNVVDETG